MPRRRRRALACISAIGARRRRSARTARFLVTTGQTVFYFFSLCASSGTPEIAQPLERLRRAPSRAGPVHQLWRATGQPGRQGRVIGAERSGGPEDPSQGPGRPRRLVPGRAAPGPSGRRMRPGRRRTACPRRPCRDTAQQRRLPGVRAARAEACDGAALPPESRLRLRATSERNS